MIKKISSAGDYYYQLIMYCFILVGSLVLGYKAATSFDGIIIVFFSIVAIPFYFSFFFFLNRAVFVIIEDNERFVYRSLFINGTENVNLIKVINYNRILKLTIVEINGYRLYVKSERSDFDYLTGLARRSN